MTQVPTATDGAPVLGGAPAGDDGLWSPERRGLTVGLVLTITLVAFEALAIATVMPEVKDDLGGLALYGWVFSGFFLASLLGIVVSGQLADRRGLALPFAAGLVLFAIGLVVGGLAQSMPMLVAGRLAQGFGAGAVPSVGYAAIGRGYPARLRPRMFATTSSAWVVPGLIGPGVAGLVEHAWSWRLVFLGLLPIVAVAGAMALPALRALDASTAGSSDPDPDPHRVNHPPGLAMAPDGLAAGASDAAPSLAADRSVVAADRDRLRRVVLLVLGVGAVLAAASDAPVVLAVGLVTVGLPLAAWAFVGLVPAGTVRLVPGVPATVAVRGILTCAFFGADAYIPLAVIDGRRAGTWVAGAALTASCLTWASGSWAQARLVDRLGPRRLVAVGFVVLVTSVLLMLAVALGVPVAFAVVAWAGAGFGMGIAYSPLSITVLAAARTGEEGTASAALQLSDTLGIAVGTGIGGSVIALGDDRGWAVSSGTAIVFAAASAVALGGVAASRRLPPSVPASHGDGASGGPHASSGEPPLDRIAATGTPPR